MKVLILGLLLIALAYGDDVPEGYVLQPDGTYLMTIEGTEAQQEAPEIPPGYVLQPDGSYLLTVEEPGQESKVPEGYVLQPDGTYLKIEEEVLDKENVIDDEDDPEYRPQFNNDIFTIGKGKNRGTFKVSRGDSNNEDDYSVEPIESPENPTPLTRDDKDAPQVYTEGTQGQPGYKNVIGVGKGQKRIYLKMKPDSSKPSGFKFVPQYISGYNTKEVPNATEEPEEEEEEEIPEEPEIQKKKGYSVICIGKPNRRYVKLTPSRNNKPNDFDLQPIKHPNQPNSKPDDDDDEAPEIIPNGQRGTPDYQPVIACGPSDNRRYVGISENPNKPNKFRFMTVNPVSQPGDPAPTEPNDDDVEFEDVPTEPTYRTIRVPGKKHPYEILSVGPPKHRVHFRVVRRSNRPGDVEVAPILDPDHPDSAPNKNNEYAPEVVQPGDPSDPNPDKCPIIATGPRFNRVYHRFLIRRNRVKFIPVRRMRDIKMRRFRYLVKRRRWHWHPRVYRQRVIRHHHKRRPLLFRKKIVTRTTTTTRRCGGGFLFGFFGGGCKKTPTRQVIKTVGGRKRIIVTTNKVVNRGYHPTRDVVTTRIHHKGGGFLAGFLG